MLKNTLTTFTLSALIATAPALAQTPYDEGQKALRESRWTVAAEQFALAIKADEQQADAAMYWRAHALYKAGKKREAARQIKQLEEQFPDSRWINEARALQIEYQDTTEGIVLDDELRLFALSQLMDRDPDRALPLVLDIMRNTDSESIREDALFVLGMSDSPEAQKAVFEAARNGPPELREHAIEMLGISGTPASLAALNELYRDATDPAVKKAVLNALAISDDTEILGQLLAAESDPELKAELLQSMAVADDVDGLLNFLQGERDPELRAAAIEALAISGGSQARKSLVSLYPSASPEEKKAVIEAMLIMDDAADLVALMKQETNPELQREMLEYLSMMDSEEADAYLFELLDPKP